MYSVPDLARMTVIYAAVNIGLKLSSSRNITIPVSLGNSLFRKYAKCVVLFIGSDLA